jgi:hypothetical protein
MKATLRITAQYHENYNVSGEGEPHWKPKGGHIFELDVDADTISYCDEEKELVPTIEVMLAGQSNSMARYTYLSHEVRFGKPTVLSKEEAAVFTASVQELMNLSRSLR